MSKVIYKKTNKTPEIIFDYEQNIVSIKGVCVPEDPLGFFDPVFEEIRNYRAKNAELLFEIYLEYFNTGASKCLLDLFLKASEYDYALKKTAVNWFIEKDDMELQEAGEVFAEITRLTFNIKEITRNK